ncbi:hypothetical protein OSB04_un001233 [Centaurea solstitialis]|uniref:Uncharacterized protein n=1 Tax=Centaurea solstitialis TaxID=347529 RepID=A0AA38VR31_9ASTR|nr:hypothetical protein OSB04_un001233 [Centaurea solstitialis]
MLKSIRILMAISAYFNYEIWQMDVKTAFLNGKLTEDVYMEQPEGFENPKNPNKVCKLLKSIYELKQASRSWNLHFDERIKEFGFAKSEFEPCVYTKFSGSIVTFLVLYVDDILLIGNDVPTLQSVKSWLSKCFRMKDLGEAAYILGIKIYRNRSKRLIGLSQSTYIDKILKKIRMDKSKKGFIPMQHGIVLSKTQCPVSSQDQDRMKSVPYASAIGSIMYAMLCTRPDVAYSVSVTSRYQQNPGELHWVAVKNILKYLRRMKDMFLVFGGSEDEISVTGYSDASFQTDKDDFRSQSGYVFTLNGGAISWKSSKQDTIADSTTEAEYIAASDAAKEAVWLRNFLSDLRVVASISRPIDIFCDNSGAVAQAKEPREHHKSRHVLRKYHLIREIIGRGDVRICKIPTEDNVADPLTKPLARVKHEAHANSIGMQYLEASIFVNIAGLELLPLLVHLKVTTASMCVSTEDQITTALGKSCQVVSELVFNPENILTMDTQETVLVSKVPMLKPNEFDMWKIRIRQYMLLTDYGMWEVVENGPGVDEAVAEGGARPPPRSDADRKRRQTEMKALSTLLLAIPNEYQHQFSTYTDAKSLWTALEKRFSGTKSTKRNQKAILKQQYENFTSLKNESMTQTFDRFNKLIGELATVDVKMDKDDVNRKFLRSLGEEWTIYTVSFRQGDDLEDKELEDLYNDLRIFEAEVEKKKRPIGYTHNTALLTSENPSSSNTTAFNNTTAAYNTTANETGSNVNSCSSQEINEDTVLEAFLASHVKSSLINDDLDQINADDLEEMDIKWQMAMLTLRMKRFIRRTGRNNFDLKRGDKAGFDKSKVRCYKCNEPGHFARECKGVTTNNQNNGSGSAQASRFNNRGSNSNPSSSQALVSQEGQGFDWSDHAEEAVQNQALMAEIKETDIPTEVSSKLCSDSCLETVKNYRDHNQTMSDSIKKMERERREYVKIIDNLEDQIKAYKANELQFEYDHNYWKWEKKELERKLSKEKEEVESARKELSKAKEDLDKFSKSSKALESIIRAQVTDDLKRGIGYNSTPPPFNQNYIPPTTDLLHSTDGGELKKGLDRIDPVDSEEEFDKKSTSETIPDEHQILTNLKGGMPFVPSKKIETTRKDKGKSVMSSENKGKKTETTRKDSRKDHYTQRTVVEPGTSSQSQNKNHPRGNKRNWNNHWAQCHGIDLSKINRPKPWFICCKTNHLARDCYFNPFNQRNRNQARKFVNTHKKVVHKQNRSSQPKRKVQKKRVEKKSVRLVTKWVPKASLSNTTASTSSGNNSVASDNSGNSFNSVEVNTASSNISSNNSNTATSQVNTAVSNNSSGNSNNVTTNKSSLRKPIITKYSSHEIPNKDYLLKLNRLTESNQGRRSSLWHVDSGCSRHMTGIMSLLEDFKRFEGGHVAFRDNPNGGKISGKGKVSKGKMTFDDVYFVEQLKYNLLSVSQVCDKKFGVFFTDTECLILAPGYKIDESKVMLRTPRKDNVYCLDIEDASSLTSLNCLLSKASVSESSLWHRRMCHMNFKNMNLLVKNNLVRGLPAKEFSSDDHCVACVKGKQHKNSHKSKEVNTISSPLQLLHMDLFGPTNVMSIGKKSYCLVIVDDYSRFTWVYFLRTKDETSGLIKPFVTRVENKTNLRVKVIRSDNGTEFKNADLNSFCEEKGIERQYSAPRTPQQNGVAERRNRTLIEAARTMLADSKLPITFWAEAVNTACYVQNRVLIVKSKGKKPYELFEKKKPYIGFVQPFGCPCTILDTKTHLGKFESKSDDGFFVGYSSQSKPLRVFNSSTRIIEESDNVKCNENTPNIPGSGPNWLFDIDSLTNSLNMSYTVNAGSGTEQAQETSPTFVMFHMPLVDSNDTYTTDESSVDDHTESGSAEKSDDQPIEESPPSQNLEGIPALEEGPQWDQEPEVNDSNLGLDLTEEPLHLTRTQKNHPPTLVIGDIQFPMITRKQSKNLPNPHLSMISVFLSQTEPKKATDAMKDPSWIEAMQEELLQFVLQHVWDLVDLPKRHKVIGTKWIFRNKTDERGIVIKNKARLVAQGYTQEEGIDYDDVFAPVARIEAIRLFLAFASYKGFKVYQMDVKSAFLYGTIDEEVYVSQPPGFEDPKYPDRVYKLRKALYGLHQAPRAWYDTLSSYLLENKFERGVIDKTLFIKRTKTDMLLVQIYVDDIIFGSTKDDMCKEFEELMHKKFKMSSMGELTFFLGLQVKQKTDGIFINQSKYVATMLQKFGMNDAKPASTPMETHKHLNADVEGEEVDVHHYRSMIGSLMYLTASRPDIMFAVCVCTRYQVRPKESHLHAVKRIFKYLKGQPRLGLWYPNDSSFDLVAYTDSDYGGANLDRKSTSGGCQFLGGRLVSWQCNKQTTVSQSTTEDEYIAASQCCSQVLWIQNQMQDYGLSFLHTPIYIDNNSAISIVNNPVKHSKTKHIEIKYHFIRDCNEKKLIQVLKVHTDDQYADLFTKSFDVGRFTFLVTGVGMINSE